MITGSLVIGGNKLSFTVSNILEQIGTGHMTLVGDRRRAQMVFMGRTEGKRLRGRSTHRREDNIKVDL
jgi:hypothetical protein